MQLLFPRQTRFGTRSQKIRCSSKKCGVAHASWKSGKAAKRSPDRSTARSYRSRIVSADGLLGDLRHAPDRADNLEFPESCKPAGNNAGLGCQL